MLGFAVALVVVYVTLLVLRLISPRLGIRPSHRAWIVVAPQFVRAAILFAAAMLILPRLPVLAAILVAGALGYAALVVSMGRTLARRWAAATTPEQLGTAAVQSTTDYLVGSTILSVLGLIVLGVAVIVWAIFTGGR